MGAPLAVGSVALGRGDIQLATGSGGQKRHRHGHPLGGDKADGLDHSFGSSFVGQLARIDDGDGVGDGVGDVETLAVRVDGERLRLGAEVALVRAGACRSSP